MAHGFRVTRFLENGDTERKQIYITSSEELSVAHVAEFSPQRPVSYPDWTEIFDISSCFVEHNINLDEYVGDLKREAMSIRMRTGNKKPEHTQNEIARMDQMYVLGILDRHPEYMARKEIVGERVEPAASVVAQNDSSVNVPPIHVVDQEITEETASSTPIVPVVTSIASQSTVVAPGPVESSSEKEVREPKSSRRGHGRKNKKNKDHHNKEPTGGIALETDAEAEEFASLVEQVKREEAESETGQNTPEQPVESRGSRRPSSTASATLAAATSRQEERVWRCVACGRAFPDQTQIAVHVIAEHSGDEDSSKATPAAKREMKPEDMDLDEDEDERAVGEVPMEGTDENDAEALARRIELVDRNSEVVAAASLLQCEFCECVFVDTPALFTHTKRHIRAEKNYECLNCAREFASHGQAIAHWQAECAHTRTGSTFTLHKFLACNVCERKFVGWDQLYNHRYKNRHLTLKYFGDNNEEVHQCDQCRHLSSTFAALMDHRSKAHPRSLRAAELAKRNHGQRSFLCEICGKAYTQSSHLWQHLRFHQGIKPFACTEPGCGRKFTIRPDLNDHIRKSHTGERPFHCTECDKRFLTGSVYYQHRLIHRGDRRYACQQCDKRFYRADALKNHARIHSGEKPYRCPVCDRCFRQRGDRDKHLKVRHGHLEEDNLHANGGNESPNHMDQHMYIRNIPPMFPVTMFQCIEPEEHAANDIY